MSSPSSRKPKKPNNFVFLIRSENDPSVAAIICRGSTPDGFPYLFFELSRAWKSGAGNLNQSSKFAPSNSRGISEVAEKASRWIFENPESAHGVKATDPIPKA